MNSKKSTIRYTAYDHTGAVMYKGSCQQSALIKLRTAGGGKIYYYGMYMADYAPERGMHHGKSDKG